MDNSSVYLVSLGCAKNLVDSEVMLGSLLRAHYHIASSPDEAAYIVINTCSFIKEAEKVAFETIFELAPPKKTGACKLLIVTGCLPQRYGSALGDLLPEVDIFIGTEEFHQIVEIIETHRDKQTPRRFYLKKPRYLYDDATPRINTSPPGSAYVKIAEGCSHRCSFCIIPEIRGPFRSRHPDSVIREVLNLSKQGIKELNLVSQDTTMYGKDLSPSADLAWLLQRLADLEEIEWIRLLYTNPQYMTDELIDVIREEKKVCNYIDLPLQHCNPEILRAMHRNPDHCLVTDLIGKIRENIPGVIIRTTLMIGFPGETEAHFNELLHFVRQMKFDRLGVFTYSNEEGTPSARLSQQVPDKIKEERKKIIMTTQAEISRNNNKKLVGTIQKVLLEKQEKSGGVGRIAGQAPEVDGITRVEADCALKPGKMYTILITGSGVYDLKGTLLIP